MPTPPERAIPYGPYGYTNIQRRNATINQPTDPRLATVRNMVRRLACFEGVLRASFALELSALLQFLCTSTVRYGRPLLKRHPNGKLAGGMTQIHADCPAFHWC